MENAEKALLIAGGILIAIIIISCGIVIYNSALEAIHEGSIQSKANAIAIFNSKFELYEGTQNERVVIKLLQEAMNANDEEEREKSLDENISDVGICSSRKEIIDNITNAEMKRALVGDRYYGVIYRSNIQKIINLINVSNKYEISFEYNKFGAIYKIHID